MDFAYGADDFRGGNADAVEFWKLATGQLEQVVSTLESNFTTAPAVQPICMTAELALKAALVFAGVSVAELKKKTYGHNLAALSQELARRLPHRDDALVDKFLRVFPDYVAARYNDQGLTRIQLVELALGSQFIAASSVRRISNRDFAMNLESAGFPGPRIDLYRI